MSRAQWQLSPRLAPRHTNAARGQVRKSVSVGYWVG